MYNLKYNLIILGDLMFTKREVEKVFRDPIYGYVRVEYDIISDLIDSKEFQRLRRIKQLSGVSMVFHLAEHSRFSHSLGAYELARKAINQINGLREKLSEYEQILLLCGALLHDLGHGPYSHSFEHVFPINHEKMTCRIICEKTEINKILISYHEDLPEDICSIIMHKGKYPIIEQLISSQLDVDRMDYLVRDSYFTGAMFGSVDIEKIFRSMEVKEKRIVVRYSAVHNIEDYLIGRYHMYWAVYYHPVARSYEIMLEKIYLRIYELLNNDFDFKVDVNLLRKINDGTLEINDYIELDDTYINGIIKALQKSDDQILNSLCSSFINRKLFRFADYETMDKENLERIKQFFTSKKDLCKYFYKEDEVRQVAYQYNAYQPLASDIHLLLPNGKTISVVDYSPIIKGLIDGIKKTDFKVFYREDLYV